MDDESERQVCGNYEIVKPIGKGKFAVVFNAKNKDTGEVVALKRIAVNMMDIKARDKCLKEVRLLESLNHPNIIRYLDSFIEENDMIIIVEWAAAGDLKRQIRKQNERGILFEERLIWKYFSQISEAIKHMHEKRIMHRDLKPANIFLTLDGTVKVGDLGLSRELSENTLQAHSKVGTPLYMSPEVLRGDGYGFQSDVWSLGCLLYELAHLKSPFKSEGLNLYSLFQKISKGEFDDLSDKYSQELRTLAYSMIAISPEERPEVEEVCIRANDMRARYININGNNTNSNIVNSSNIVNNMENHCDPHHNRANNNVKTNEYGKTNSGNANQKVNESKMNDRDEEFIHQSKMPSIVTHSNDHHNNNNDNNNKIDDNENDDISDRRKINSMKFKERISSPPIDTDLPVRVVKNTRSVQPVQGAPKKELASAVDSITIPSHVKEEKISSPSKSNSANTSPVTMALATILHSKLELINCKIKRPCRHLHFCTDLGSSGGKIGKLYHNQFKTFLDVSQWLLFQIDDSYSFNAVDSTIIAVKDILVKSQKVGVRLEDLSAITPTSLLPGYGLQVVTLLTLLVDLYISSKRYDQIETVYLSAQQNDFNESDVDSDGGQIKAEEDIRDNESSIEDYFLTYEQQDEQSQSIRPLDMDISPHEVAAWKAETERLSSILLSRARNIGDFNDGWRVHFKTMLDHMDKLFGSGTGLMMSSANAVGASVLQLILGIHISLRESNRTLLHAENILNLKGDINSHAEEFSSHMENLQVLELKVRSLQVEISNKSAELVELDERLDDMSFALKDKLKTNGDLDEEGVRGPTVEIKNALKALKAEIKEMSFRIELTNASLISKKIELTGASNRARRKKKADLRLRFSKFKSKLDDEFLDFLV